MLLLDRPADGVAPVAPVAAAAPSLAAPSAAGVASSGEARVFRRLRRVVRRRVRFDLGVQLPHAVGDGTVTVAVAPMAGSRLAWRASREMALVVLHTGCGMRLVGSGGVAGEVELPCAPQAGSYLAFCYDDDAVAAA